MASNLTKLKYIEKIRAETAYPAFRSLINLFAILLYLLGGFFILFGFIGGLVALFHTGAQGIGLMVGGTIAGLIYIIMGKVSKEAAFMLADVADSITDMNSRYDQQH